MKPAEFAAACGMELATLRAWERRYGFPAPQRTKGGHRRYSQDLVASVLEAQRLIEQGWRVPAAVALAAAGAPAVSQVGPWANEPMPEVWVVHVRGRGFATFLSEQVARMNANVERQEGLPVRIVHLSVSGAEMIAEWSQAAGMDDA